MTENQNVEWKETWRDEYLKWICGFANAQGGKIYIGKDDRGKVVGIANSKKLMEDIPNKVRDILGIIVDVNLFSENHKNYLEIIINPSSYPVNYKGEYHYRSGSTKQLLKGASLTEFLTAKTGRSWDDIPVDGVAVEDLDKESFDIFRRQALQSQRMDETDLKLSNRQLLDNLGLLDGEKLNRAAIYNALIHQNYASQIPMQISVYADKLYVSNDCILPVGWTIETLMNKHRSKPYNPSIANGFFRAGLVEIWGRGIEKICESCKMHGIPIPEYTIYPEDIMVCFQNPNLTNKQNVQDGTLDGTLDNEQKQIIEEVIKNPGITQKEISERHSLSLRQVKRIMKNLSEQGIIERIGGKRFGYWKVNGKVK